jgi:hypothetical protein
MSYRPENTIHTYRSEVHGQLLLRSATPKRQLAEHALIFSLITPLVAIGTFFALQQRDIPPNPSETYRAAAPEGYSEDERDIDDTEVTEFICNELCAKDSSTFTQFCLEACPIKDGKDTQIEPQIEIEREKIEPETMQVKQTSITPQESITVETKTTDIGAATPVPEEEIHSMYRDFAPRNVEITERQPHNQIGIYLTSTSVGRESRFERALSNLDTSKANAFVFDVKGSRVYFDSNAPLAHELGLVKPTYDLPIVIQEAKNHGLYTIARFIVAKDPSLASRRPETQIQNIYTDKGIGSTWVNPGHETVITYNQEVLRDLIASGIDEINFDYIRYPTEYSLQAIGLSGEEKADRIEKFLRMAREMVEELGSDTKIGISTYAILGWNFPINFEPLGQDIVRFSPLVDVISPMAYPATFSVGGYYNPAKHPGSRMYYLVYRTLQGYKELLGEDSWKLRPWIQGYYVNAQNMSDQAHAVYDSGLCGFTVWSAQNTYQDLYKALGNMEMPPSCT